MISPALNSAFTRPNVAATFIRSQEDCDETGIETAMADVAVRACHYFIATEVRIESADGEILAYGVANGYQRLSPDWAGERDSGLLPQRKQLAPSGALKAHTGDTGSYIQFQSGACELTIELADSRGNMLARVFCCDSRRRVDWERLDRGYVSAIAGTLSRLLERNQRLARLRNPDAQARYSHIDTVLDDIELLTHRNDGDTALLEVFLLSPEQEWRVARTLGVREARIVEDELHARLEALTGDAVHCFRTAPNSALVLVTDCPCAQAESLAGRLAESLGQPIDRETGASVTPQVCVGLAHVNGSRPVAAGELIRRAYVAANLAYKRSEAWASYSAEADHAERRMARLARDLPAALTADDQLYLVYQPQVSLPDYRCERVEALLRWRHPELGGVSPADIIAAVEGQVLMQQLSDWVMDTAVRQVAEWRECGLDLSVSINMSAADFTGGRLADRIGQTLSRYAVPGSALEVEFTETLLVQDFRRSALQIRKLQRLGVSVAMDDFGTGYSNFSYLMRLPINALKFDRSFVHEKTWDKRSETILKGIVSIASELGVRTVAEGIECAEISDAVLACGCETSQGYLFCKPVTAKQLETDLLRDAGLFEPAR